MNLALLAELNALETQLDEVQALIDKARSNFPFDGAFQYECDLQQAVLDTKRTLVMDTKNQILSPN